MFSVLIVDDNEVDISGIVRFIPWDSFGVNVIHTAFDGICGYNKTLEVKPDIVLTDVSMPHMNGIEMAEKIKSALPKTKFIFMSCFDDFEYLQGAINLEAYGYVLKPIDLEELKTAIRKVCDLRKAEMDDEKRVKELREQIHQSLPLLQEQFIRDLLQGRLEDEMDIEERIRFFETDFKDRPYTVICIEIDNYEMVYKKASADKKYFISHMIREIVTKTLLKEFFGFVTIIDHSRLTVILFNHSDGQEEFINSAITAADICRAEINEKLDISITIGIGEIGKRLLDMPKIFNSAQYAVVSKFYSGGNRILLAAEIKENDVWAEYNLQEIRSEISYLLEQEDSSGIERFAEKYFHAKYHYSQISIKSLSFSIVNIIQTALVEKNLSIKDVFGDEHVIWGKLANFETILDIKQWVINIINSVRQYLKKRESNRYQRLAEEIKAIIDERYVKIENINQIVESLYISPRYANTKFKQQTGETIGDYLLKRRMEAAKELLKDSSVKIYEISELVGYKSPVYFSSVFKEYTGILPKEYRDRHAR